MPHRLLQLRHLDGLTAEQAADKFAVPLSTYSAIERGDRKFTLDADRVGYSYERLTSLPNMSDPLHRQRASVGERIIRSNREQLRSAGELMTELRGIVPNAPRIAIAQLEMPTSLAAVDDLAVEARYMLRISQDEPITNLTSVFERAGICLTPIHDPNPDQTGKRVDGLSAWVDNQPTIGINPDAPGDRYRITLAHELGHLLMHHRPSATAESEAFRFGAALLVPTEIFVDTVGPRPTMKQFGAVKRVWGMSIAAGIYRAHELDIIDEDRYRSLQMQMAKWQNKEPGAFEIRPGRLLPRLVEAAGSTAKAADTLGIAERHIRRAIAWEVRRFHAIIGGGQGETAPASGPPRLSALR